MEPVEVMLECQDGVRLQAHRWSSAAPIGTVVINPATGVLARYYHRYAAFMAAHGFDAMTYDYRGIGHSGTSGRHAAGYDWRQWGQRDFQTVLQYAMERNPELPVSVIGHSIGGFLPGLAENGCSIHRMLTVGAQYGHWRDYAAAHKLGLMVKWHVAMPAMTAMLGYFPGRRLGWLEDLPAGVAYSWSLGRKRFERRLPPSDRATVLARFAAVTAPILAVSVSDDAFATRPAMDRALGYFEGAPRTKVMLLPRDLDCSSVGHFDLFHARHASGFWLDTLLWLRDGTNPWPQRQFD